MASFACPSTPPPARKVVTLASPPSEPITPHSKKKPVATPRTERRQLTTPVTQRKKAFVTPTKQAASLNSKLHACNKLPPTPEFTPQKNRKNKVDVITPGMMSQLSLSLSILSHLSRRNPNSSFLQTPKNRDFSFGMFLPTPSTVGSGRKLRPFKKLTHDTPDDDDNDFSFTPHTPGKQLIDEQLVHHWHGKSYNHEFSSEDELSDNETISIASLENPFVGTYKPKDCRKLELSAPSIDYATHAEYINNKTGEVKIVKLLERQMAIKPKKLAF